MRNLFIGIALLAANAACLSPSVEIHDRAPKAELHIRCNVPGAIISVDEEELGTIADYAGGMRLPPGKFRLQISDENHYAYYQLIELKPNTRTNLQIELAKLVPES